MTYFDNETDRFGSAGLASRKDIRQAALMRVKPGGIFIGFCGKHPLFYNGMGGITLVAGARSGKLTTILAYIACPGFTSHNLVFLDLKGEIAAISQDQREDGKHCYYWNPVALHGLPQHRINPFDYLTKDSPTLVADMKVVAENLIPTSGSANGAYFENRAREVLEAIGLTLVHLNGTLTFPDLYSTINLVPGNGEEWLDFSYDMHKCGHGLAQRIEEEIAQSRDNATGGFQGILGELFKSISALSDPLLMASVSPPFNFSFQKLCEADPAKQVYLMPPAEFAQSWSPVIKAIFVSGMIHKSRRPDAPKQTWVLDECGQLGAFPLIPKLYTYGAGIGIQPLCVFQTAEQMDLLGKKAGALIQSSAACSIWFAIRDQPSADALSRKLGAQTLEFDNTLQQEKARLAKTQAAQALINGGDPFASILSYRHYAGEAEHRTKQRRMVRDSTEVMATPSDKAYVFVDGLRHPIYADRRPYFEERFMTGRYMPNPYHPPVDSLRVKRRWGFKTIKVIEVPVPANLAHFPQYQSGTMRILKG